VLEKVVDVNSQGGFYGNVFRAARAKRPREGGLGAAGEGRRRLRLSGHDGHQSDKLTDEDISHQSTLNCHQSTPKLTVAEAESRATHAEV
jgi:hypothetical protein